ncbi:hypothetical protein [Actinosynnema sp. NPDC020468]|uniref:hypothetical protein n=1 Tax=Actinosynnema sp. NPDC020468 TaxID=3154488 RepID=UPI0033DB8408
MKHTAKLLGAALAVAALVGVGTFAVDRPQTVDTRPVAAASALSCKDVMLFTYIESGGDRIAAVPFRVRPCGDEHPGSWDTGVSAPSSNATGDNVGWVLQGLDIRLDHVGNNSRTSATAHYKGVAKLTQKTPNVPLLAVAPMSLRSISLAITFTVHHQKKPGKSKNVRLPNLVKVDGTWSSHPDWARFVTTK